MDTTNEPVAMRYDFDGYGYQYIDSGSGSDWQTRVDGEPLYTHPSEHDLGIAEAIGFDKGYKAATAKTLTDAEFDNIFANGKRLGVLETEDRFCKAKTLTDEEIKLPVAHPEIDVGSVYTFDHIDGMYSLCRDENKQVVHFAAWTEVQEVE